MKVVVVMDSQNNRTIKLNPWAKEKQKGITVRRLTGAFQQRSTKTTSKLMHPDDGWASSLHSKCYLGQKKYIWLILFLSKKESKIKDFILKVVKLQQSWKSINCISNDTGSWNTTSFDLTSSIIFIKINVVKIPSVMHKTTSLYPT